MGREFEVVREENVEKKLWILQANLSTFGPRRSRSLVDGNCIYITSTRLI